MTKGDENAISLGSGKETIHGRLRTGARGKVAARELGFGAFVIRFALAFAITCGIIWAYVAAMPMAFENRDYPLLVAKREIAARCIKGVVAVFGDSRAVAGVLPAAMGVPTENLAMSGTSPVETYFMVKRLLRCPTPPRLVIIAHSASSYTGDDNFWQFDAWAGFLGPAQIRQVSEAARRLDDDELRKAKRSQDIPYALLPFLYEIRFPPLYFGSLVNGYVAGRWLYNRHVVRETLASSGHALYGTAPRSDGAAPVGALSDWRASPLINLYLRRTLALLAARKVPALILPMPVNQTTCRRLPHDAGPRFGAYLDRLGEQYPNVIAADPVIGCWPDRYYGDAWHFNKRGAQAFSRDLGRLIADLPLYAGSRVRAADRPALGRLAALSLTPPGPELSDDE